MSSPQTLILFILILVILFTTVFGDNVENTERVVDVLDKFCEDKIVPFIDTSYDELSDYLQCYEKTLVMKRECIAREEVSGLPRRDTS